MHVVLLNVLAAVFGRMLTFQLTLPLHMQGSCVAVGSACDDVVTNFHKMFCGADCTMYVSIIDY